jgi:23S rRNA (guanosine2251-2'-O)-methyltransferase
LVIGVGNWFLEFLEVMHKFTTDELVAQKPSAEDFAKLKRNPIVFIVHNVRSLQNVGLFFRLADAIRAEKIYLTGYTGYPNLPSEALAKLGIENDPRRPGEIEHAENQINKTAIQLVPHVPWERKEDIHGLITDLHQSGYQIVSVEQTDQSIDYRTTDYRLPTALIFGHERTGVEDEILEKSDLIVHIPMLGMGNSHNVAMSAAIVSYHLLDVIKS